ncbi:CBS domain-containing protein [Streptomyces sp. BF23-18]|uniref:CBS domain-containing protein n=1 Tax=Streptomyces sp. BF23-18 TaxID=3240282 RepID=UPI0034E534F4
MTRHGIERLPVVDEKDRLVDIVSHRDPLQVLPRSAEEIWQAVRREVFAAALRVSPQISEVAAHDGAVTLTAQLDSMRVPGVCGCRPPATLKLGHFLLTVKGGEVSVPVVASPEWKLLARPLPLNPATVPYPSTAPAVMFYRLGPL